jgi:DNA-binding PadR family transcriptional regulator
MLIGDRTLGIQKRGDGSEARDTHQRHEASFAFYSPKVKAVDVSVGSDTSLFGICLIEVRESRILSDIVSQTADDLLPLPAALFQILVALADRERHGYGIMQDIAARTDGKMRLSPGTLYGSIKRMLDQRLIEESDERPDPALDDERRRYYRITEFGRQVAAAETERLSKLVSQAVASLLPKSRPV